MERLHSIRLVVNRYSGKQQVVMFQMCMEMEMGKEIKIGRFWLQKGRSIDDVEH